MKQLNDISPMPYGKYKGVKMANIPAQITLFGYMLPGKHFRALKNMFLKTWMFWKKKLNKENRSFHN